MKTQVMKRAWELAKEGVVAFGGKVKEYFQQALVIAWEEAKTVVKVAISTMDEAVTVLRKGLYRYEVTANAWEKHGLRRIYITVDGFKGYLQFDTNDMITKTFIDTRYDVSVRSEVELFAKMYNEGKIYA